MTTWPATPFPFLLHRGFNTSEIYQEPNGYMRTKQKPGWLLFFSQKETLPRWNKQPKTDPRSLITYSTTSELHPGKKQRETKENKFKMGLPVRLIVDHSYLIHPCSTLMSGEPIEKLLATQQAMKKRGMTQNI